MAQAVTPNSQAAPGRSHRTDIVRPPPWLFPERRLLVAMGMLTVAYAAFWLGGSVLWAWYGAISGIGVPSVLGWAGDGSLRILLLAVPPVVAGGAALAIGHRRQGIIRQRVKAATGLMCRQCGTILCGERPSSRCCECGSAVDLAALRDFWTHVAQPRHLPVGWSGRITYIVGLCAIGAFAHTVPQMGMVTFDWDGVARSIVAGVVTVGPGIWFVQQLWVWAAARFTSPVAPRASGLPASMHAEPRGPSPRHVAKRAGS
jgi:hypothetical protein